MCFFFLKRMPNNWASSIEKFNSCPNPRNSCRKMSAGPILEFFKPLHVWLDEENEKNGDTLGW